MTYIPVYISTEEYIYYGLANTKKRPAEKPPSFVISMVRNSLVQKKEIYLTQCLLKSALKLACIDYSCNIDRFMDHCCSCPIMAIEWTTPSLHQDY